MNRTSGRIVWAVVCAAVFLGGLACASAPKPDPACQGAACDPKGCICEEGKRQSPIDLAGAVASPDLPALEFVYPDTVAVDLVDTGTTLKAKAVAPGRARLVVGSESYDFHELHFHAPSEHRVADSLSPLEMHIVHENALGEPAVVGVLWRAEKDRPNPAIEKLWRSAPPPGAPAVRLEIRLDALLPANRSSYTRYAGSLTTAPCAEGVRWYVLRDQAILSPEQVGRYRYPHSARATQPLNGRPVLLRTGG